ncbi:M13 family metallopeptidase [Halocynthiibacter sp. C4]|uniref:M13 family metallopeptidase n=1 Tax=Halocynthiibacter sp. C4 TaxID=2992758 RepID=UPI00237AE364|nr:M13 family metallopeptidase [Halocynthiibacter sp. C4]MDE0589701.1 M13 family metallopeptidase [Halocynthiibacter sp. C4]
MLRFSHSVQTTSLKPKGVLAALGCSVALSGVALAEELPPVGPDDLAFSIENMDLSVDPGENFYRYVSGKWQDRVERPEQLSSYGSLTIAGERVKAQMKIALKEAGEAAATAEKGSPTQQVGDFYNAYMDTEALDAAGIEPIRGLLEEVSAITDLAGLTEFMSKMMREGGPSLFLVLAPMADLADSKTYAYYAAAGLFGIDSHNEDLLREGPGGERYEGYKTYIMEILEISGFDAADAERIAKTSLEIEAALLEGKLTPEEMVDPRNFYNPVTRDELQAAIPEIDLVQLTTNVGMELPERVILSAPRYLPVLSKVLQERTIEDIRDYVTFRVIHNYSDLMTTEFDEPTRKFTEVLTGVGVLLPREERALSLLKEALGHPLSQIYVEKYYPEETRQKALDMVERIQDVFRSRIPSRDWLSEETKKAALLKLDSFDYKIGYPDEWIDYTGVDIGSDMVANYRNLSDFENTRLIERSKGPVVSDQFNEESTLPIVINAAYSPLENGFQVPAAIQQPPIFQADMDAPVYFCRLGGIIGHEMTHGFDTGGRQFDAEGNLRDWWTAEDAEAFEKEAQKLIDQANAVEILPGLYVNGELNVKENMADTGGIAFAHEALMHYLEEHPEENVEIDGLTPSQRCFISWGQMWTWKATDQFIRSLVASDGHPPGEYRAYAPLQHMEAFYEAFDIQEGDPMWLAPEKRVEAW